MSSNAAGNDRGHHLRYYRSHLESAPPMPQLPDPAHCGILGFSAVTVKISVPDCVNVLVGGPYRKSPSRKS